MTVVSPCAIRAGLIASILGRGVTLNGCWLTPPYDLLANSARGPIAAFGSACTERTADPVPGVVTETVRPPGGETPYAAPSRRLPVTVTGTVVPCRTAFGLTWLTCGEVSATATPKSGGGVNSRPG